MNFINNKKYNNMLFLGIKGDKFHGREIIELLKMFGGNNSYSRYRGTNSESYYYIDEKDHNYIKLESEDPIYNKQMHSISRFTFEEFKHKFPYKVGQNVKYYNQIITIHSVKWYGTKPLYEFYAIDDDSPLGIKFHNCCVDMLKPLDIISNLPTSVNECLKYSDNDETFDVYSYRGNLFSKLQTLFFCRNVYWKLCDNYNPTYEPLDNTVKYCIYTFNGEIKLSETSHRQAILAFPSEEVRDKFYESFKYLIEDCKEFL